jgi:hypothetical protein
MFRGVFGSERALAARLRGDAGVVWADPDYLRQTSTIDPRLWAFYNPGGLTIGFTRGRNNGQAVTSYLSTDDADQDDVEGYASGGGAVKIASIDTGVDFGHTEFLPGSSSSSTGATSWSWAFGDNATGSGETTAHSYAGVGNYIVTLTVGDGSGSDQTSQTVRCKQRSKSVRCN